MRRAFLALTVMAVCAMAALARAVDGNSDEPVRLDLRLIGSDLADEMVFDWLGSPPFRERTPLIVAEIDAPIGIDQRFAQDIENRLFELLRANSRLSMELVHCSFCRQRIATSNPKRTVIGPALSSAGAIEELQKYPALRALSMHFDVVDDDLVLWAEIYETAPPQRVVWSRRFAAGTSSRALLRDATHLVSVAEAREEQHRLLEGRDRIQLVTRFPIRTFASNANGPGSSGGTQIPPLIFIEQSFETDLSPKRNSRAGLSVGVTSIKDSLQGWSVGASYQQLLFRDSPSLNQPDLYLRAAVTYLRLDGPGAAPFAVNQVDLARIANAKDDPKASLTALQIGIETHVKYRFGFSAFVEYIPVLEGGSLIATQRLIAPVHSIGFAGVLLW